MIFSGEKMLESILQFINQTDPQITASIIS